MFRNPISNGKISPNIRHWLIGDKVLKTYIVVSVLLHIGKRIA
jgi:hypothetical protein